MWQVTVLADSVTAVVCMVTMDILLLQGFQAAAAQQMGNAPGDAEPDLTALRRAAMIIYDQYLSDKVGVAC